MMGLVRRWFDDRQARRDAEELRREQMNVMVLEDDYAAQVFHSKYHHMVEELSHIVDDVSSVETDGMRRPTELGPNPALALQEYYDSKRLLIEMGLNMGMSRRAAHQHMVLLLPMLIGQEYQKGK